MKNISLKVYFDKLHYEFIETYSFKRGPKLESELGKKDFDLNGTSFIMSAQGQIDVTADKIAVIRKGTSEHEEINRIFAIPLTDIPSWMCSPFYRDALIFRSKDNQIVDTLNICFECSYMQNKLGNFIDADQRMYDEVQSLLKSLGHNIQKDESLQLREKIKGLKKVR
ncbi:hypothetical protein WBG78_30655 [Chryseolinea sp. T2]|uniref:hypothetical protein n=1 Tax=Chryseolinea sp. T2 TaxID=3129255 RepID=UPI0030787F66